MNQDDDFWNLVERGKERLGFDDPVPLAPKPLRKSLQPEQDSRKLTGQSGDQATQKPLDEPSPLQDRFWEKVDDMVGKPVEAAPELKGPDYFWRHVASLHYRHAVCSRREGEEISGEELVELEVHSEHAKPWPASQVPQDLWQRIKQGRVKNHAIQVLAPLLVRLTQEPGLKLTIDPKYLCESLSHVRGDEYITYLENKEWFVYNFRDGNDLATFEERVNKTLRAQVRVAKPQYQDMRWVYDTMYGDVEDPDRQAMAIFRYLPGASGQWELHPTVAAAGEEWSAWADPPMSTSHETMIVAWSDVLGGNEKSSKAEIKEQLDSIGYKYTSLVAKEMILWRIMYIGYALLVGGL